MKTPLSEKFFRPGFIQSRKANFILSGAGLGDYIGYMSSIVYIAENHPQIHGRVFCTDWFIPLAENFLQKFPRWEVFSRKDLTEIEIRNRPTFGPYDKPINRIGAHAVDLGFIYYLNMTPPPVGEDFYPVLDLSTTKGYISPGDYVVMTPGASNLPRTMPAKTFNAIKTYLIEKGFTPVFLGNTSFRQAPVSIELDYDFQGGMNLIGRTTLLEAAKIMSEAKAVIGLDNGLLHLAATSDVPIVFGYTTSHPEHAMPRRKKGMIVNVHADKTQLPCLFCQSQMRMFSNHDFKDCYYKDNACTQVPVASWTKAIHSILFPV